MNEDDSGPPRKKQFNFSDLGCSSVALKRSQSPNLSHVEIILRREGEVTPTIRLPTSRT